jgi:peptidoglycan-N-acetylglucosamine deacetylase
MKKSVYLAILCSFINTYAPTSIAAKEIALTVDDLPFVGSSDNNEGNIRRARERFLSILASIKDNQVPATGFIIAKAIGKGQWELLEEFRNAGLELGNHTYSHANLNHLSAQKYIEEIARADQILSPVMTTPKYFRYPYLAEGKGATKQEVQEYLAKQQYVIAPVTIDSKDYMFNERLLHIPWRVRSQHFNSIKNQYLSFIWKQTQKVEKRSNNTRQILLVHANLLNSLFLNDVIQMYKNNGYTFITLDKALAANSATSANSIPDNNQTNIDNNIPEDDLAWVTQV